MQILKIWGKYKAGQIKCQTPIPSLSAPIMEAQSAVMSYRLWNEGKGKVGEGGGGGVWKKSVVETPLRSVIFACVRYLKRTTDQKERRNVDTWQMFVCRSSSPDSLCRKCWFPWADPIAYCLAALANPICLTFLWPTGPGTLLQDVISLAVSAEPNTPALAF